MKKYEDLKIKETEIEWQALQEETVEWNVNVDDSKGKTESKDERRRKEAMIEAADYEETEFEDIGFERRTNAEADLQNGRRFPVWILPVLAILVCIPLFLLAQRQDEAREVANKQSEALVASVSREEQTQASQERETSVAATNAGANSGNGTEAGVEATQESGNAQEGIGEENSNATAEGQVSENSNENVGNGAGRNEGQSHVSGDVSMDFDSVSDVVTAIDATNLRTVPSTEGSGVIIAQLKHGQNIARTGINEETGWSRVEYFGQVLYAVTQFLTTDVSEAPLIDDSGEEDADPLDISTVPFLDCDDYIKTTSVVNLRTEPSTARGTATVKVQVNAGLRLHRTGYTADKQWSRVEYNGEILYIINTYVETEGVSTQTDTSVSSGNAA